MEATWKPLDSPAGKLENGSGGKVKFDFRQKLIHIGKNED
jgi:hypothetical protein